MLDLYKQWGCDKRRKYLREANEARIAKGLIQPKKWFFQWMRKKPSISKGRVD